MTPGDIARWRHFAASLQISPVEMDQRSGAALNTCLDEIERLRRVIDDAWGQLVWAGGLAQAGDRAVIDELADTVIEIANELADATTGVPS